jgi:hypothetical protein
MQVHAGLPDGDRIVRTPPAILWAGTRTPDPVLKFARQRAAKST